MAAAVARVRAAAQSDPAVAATVASAAPLAAPLSQARRRWWIPATGATAMIYAVARLRLTGAHREGVAFRPPRLLPLSLSGSRTGRVEFARVAGPGRMPTSFEAPALELVGRHSRASGVAIPRCIAIRRPRRHWRALQVSHNGPTRQPLVRRWRNRAECRDSLRVGGRVPEAGHNRTGGSPPICRLGDVTGDYHTAACAKASYSSASAMWSRGGRWRHRR